MSASRAAKLRAIIAPSSGATDGERANARTLLERLEGRTAAEAESVRQRTFVRRRIRIDIDEFLKGYTGPGFSNENRRPKRPVVDRVDRTRADGATVGTLQFGDVLGPGAERLEELKPHYVDAEATLEANAAITLGPGPRSPQRPL